MDTVKVVLYITIKNILQNHLENAMDNADFAKLFNQIVKKVKIKVDYEYRLYYNKVNGKPIRYTTDTVDQGDYLVISKQQYAEGRYDILVIDEKIRTLNSFDQWTKLVPAKHGISTRADNVMIVDDNGAAKWKIKTYYRD
jgi:hypothetical protein